MQYEAAERKLKAEDRLRVISAKIEAINRETSSAQDREPLMRQLEDVETELAEIRGEQLKQIKHGIQLSKAISELVADVSSNGERAYSGRDVDH